MEAKFGFLGPSAREVEGEPGVTSTHSGLGPLSLTQRSLPEKSYHSLGCSLTLMGLKDQCLLIPISCFGIPEASREIVSHLQPSWRGRALPMSEYPGVTILGRLGAHQKRE